MRRALAFRSARSQTYSNWEKGELLHTGIRKCLIARHGTRHFSLVTRHQAELSNCREGLKIVSKAACLMRKQEATVYKYRESSTRLKRYHCRQCACHTRFEAFFCHVSVKVLQLERSGFGLEFKSSSERFSWRLGLRHRLERSTSR